jgi:hypothetical protein
VVAVLVASGEKVELGEPFHALELGHEVFGVREWKSVFDRYLIQTAMVDYHPEQWHPFRIEALRNE